MSAVVEHLRVRKKKKKGGGTYGTDMHFLCTARTGLAGFVGKVEDQARIHVTASGRTGEAREGRQAHSRVDRSAILDRAGAGAAAEVQRDYIGVALRLLQEGGDGAGDEGVADAVEAVFAQLVRLGDVRVDGVGADCRGEGGVEGGVEVGDVFCGGEGFDAGAHDG